ncbi:hypothetical protein [Roseivirga sp.]|uniref:hypothetical protein n=1 Tax=Roseivirga sp. TaxID=1964215 RepID=UPI002B26EECA|nr:hypothetical protein [Roseivirga sp.]
MGFSDRKSLCPENSIRFRWTYFIKKGLEEIFSYTHKWVTDYQYMDAFVFGDKAHYQIQIMDDKFSLLPNGEIEKEVL